MLDEPGRSEMLETTTDTGDAYSKRTRHGPPPRPAQRHKRAGSEISEADSESHDDGLKSGKHLSSNSMRIYVVQMPLQSDGCAAEPLNVHSVKQWFNLLLSAL